MDALAQTINRAARRPSELARLPIPSKLDRLIHDCHSRVVTERPQTIHDVLSRLQKLNSTTNGMLTKPPLGGPNINRKSWAKLTKC